MYREPHLQKKSDECSKIWYQWFEQKYEIKDEENAKKLRRKWCKGCDDFGEMVSQEVKTNPRYNSIRKI